MSALKETAFDAELEKIKIEKEKLLLERDKMKLERYKTWWTGASIFIPLLIAAISISYSFYTSTQQSKLQIQLQKQQAESQMALQERQAQSQFELKAAEIALNARTPMEAKTKAKAMANIFPDRLPPNFAESFNPRLYSMQVAKAKSKTIAAFDWRKTESPNPLFNPNVPVDDDLKGIYYLESKFDGLYVCCFEIESMNAPSAKGRKEKYSNTARSNDCCLEAAQILKELDPSLEDDLPQSEVLHRLKKEIIKAEAGEKAQLDRVMKAFKLYKPEK